MSEGLRNEGMTCYLNSVMSSLMENPYFPYYYFANKHHEFNKLASLIRDLYENRQKIKELVDYLSTIWPQNIRQQSDPSVFYFQLMDQLDRDEDSHLTEMLKQDFYKFKYCKYCGPIGEVSTTSRYYYEIKSSGRLQELIDQQQIFRPVDDPCPKCKSTNLHYFMNFYNELPRVMYVKPLYDMELSSKPDFSQTVVTFPYFKTPIDAIEGKELRSDEYELFGVVIHRGMTTFGHCICTIRNPEGSEWLTYDDSSIRNVPRYDSEIDKHSRPSLLIFTRKGDKPSRVVSHKMATILQQTTQIDEQIINGFQ